MNLDALGALAKGDALAPPEWSMDVDREGLMYTATVKRSLEEMCRLSIVSEGLDEQQARTRLAHKARVWIRDYLQRASHDKVVSLTDRQQAAFRQKGAHDRTTSTGPIPQ